MRAAVRRPVAPATSAFFVLPSAIPESLGKARIIAYRRYDG
jgi:hypothetical protein